MVNLLAPDDAKTEALSLTSHDVLKLWYFLWIIVSIVKVKQTLIFVPFISVHNMYFQLLTYFLCLPWVPKSTLACDLPKAGFVSLGCKPGIF